MVDLGQDPVAVVDFDRILWLWLILCSLLTNTLPSCKIASVCDRHRHTVMRPQGPFTQEPALNAASEALSGKDTITKIRFPVSSGHFIDWTHSTLVTTSRVCKSCGEGDLKGHCICPKCNANFGVRNPGTRNILTTEALVQPAVQS